MDTVWLAASLAFVLGVGLGVGLMVWRTNAAHQRHEPPSEETAASAPAPGPQLAFVVNPSKERAQAIRPHVESLMRARGLPEPTWFETTPEDSGAGAARDALATHPDVVVAAGGDGTVRAVASVLAHTDTAMGILPLGTGNLLARNVGIDPADLDACFEVLLAPARRTIDVGHLRLPDAPPDSQGDVFLVIAGIGFDGAMVADTDARLKRSVGWLAYFFAAMRHLHSRRLPVRIQLDDGPEVTTRLRTLLVGNCGRLPAGIVLLPDALPDDGILDIAAVDTRAGIVGWAGLLGEVVVVQGRTGRHRPRPRQAISRIDHARATRTSVTVLADPQPVQLDGDVIADARGFTAWVDPAALTICAPAPRLDLRGL